jgi:DNA repair exonuclease SbcCD ATPase subunit
MSNDKHTPTPWSDAPLAKVNIIISEADWKHAVKCVNEYDGLMAKIELLKDSHREYLLVRSNLKDLTKDYNAAQSELATLRAEKAELVEALRSIITQWDTPNWKLTESTGTIINQARQTLAKYETP